MDFFNDSANLGFNLYCVMKTKNNTWETYVAPEQGKGPKKYYYYESIFSDKELITLIDSVETYNYFSTEDIVGLVSKLLAIRPQSEVLNKYHISDNQKLKDEDSLVLPNIDELSKIIKKQQLAKIIYCNYNHEKELVPRNGYPRIIRPLSMMWSNGYYYLVALLKPGYAPANLRIDRITEIEAVDPSPQMRKDYSHTFDLDVSAYRMKHPVMHGGQAQHITMLFFNTPSNNIINSIIDTFGRTVTIKPATTDEIKKYIPLTNNSDSQTGTWMRVDFNATTAGTELFATQYCRYCKIISPASLADSITSNLKSGLELYT